MHESMCFFIVCRCTCTHFIALVLDTVTPDYSDILALPRLWGVYCIYSLEATTFVSIVVQTPPLLSIIVQAFLQRTGNISSKQYTVHNTSSKQHTVHNISSKQYTVHNISSKQHTEHNSFVGVYSKLCRNQ